MGAKQIDPHLVKKFGSLRSMVVLYKLFGILIGAGALIAAFSSRSGWASWSIAISGLSIAGTCFIVAEGIEVILAIEGNTRQTVLYSYQTSLHTSAQAAAGAATLTPAFPSSDIQELLQTVQSLATQSQMTTTQLTNIATALTEISTHTRAVEESSRLTAIMLHRQQGVAAHHN